MSYSFYKVLHFVGLFLLFSGLGARLTIFALQKQGTSKIKTLSGIFHGVGLILTLVGGFGLLARLQVGFPMWIYAKLAIWLILGFITIFPKRNHSLVPATLVSIVVLGGLAAFLAISKAI